MFVNLIAAIEADINLAQQKIITLSKSPTATNYELQQLHVKKKKLAELAMQYVGLQNQYREISGANSIY
jgi:hypothetical protein